MSHYDDAVLLSLRLGRWQVEHSPTAAERAEAEATESDRRRAPQARTDRPHGQPGGPATFAASLRAAPSETGVT